MQHDKLPDDPDAPIYPPPLHDWDQTKGQNR